MPGVSVVAGAKLRTSFSSRNCPVTALFEASSSVNAPRSEPSSIGAEKETSTMTPGSVAEAPESGKTALTAGAAASLFTITVAIAALPSGCARCAVMIVGPLAENGAVPLYVNAVKSAVAGVGLVLNSVPGWALYWPVIGAGVSG